MNNEENKEKRLEAVQKLAIENKKKKENKIFNYDKRLINFPKFEHEEIKEAFDCFDINSGGSISAQELKFIFKSLNEEVLDEEIDEMIRLADKEGDGQVNFKNFLEFILGTGIDNQAEKVILNEIQNKQKKMDNKDSKNKNKNMMEIIGDAPDDNNEFDHARNKLDLSKFPAFTKKIKEKKDDMSSNKLNTKNDSSNAVTKRVSNRDRNQVVNSISDDLDRNSEYDNNKTEVNKYKKKFDETGQIILKDIVTNKKPVKNREMTGIRIQEVDDEIHTDFEIGEDDFLSDENNHHYSEMKQFNTNNKDALIKVDNFFNGEDEVSEIKEADFVIKKHLFENKQDNVLLNKSKHSNSESNKSSNLEEKLKKTKNPFYDENAIISMDKNNNYLRESKYKPSESTKDVKKKELMKLKDQKMKNTDKKRIIENDIIVSSSNSLSDIKLRNYKNKEGKILKEKEELNRSIKEIINSSIRLDDAKQNSKHSKQSSKRDKSEEMFNRSNKSSNKGSNDNLNTQIENKVEKEIKKHKQNIQEKQKQEERLDKEKGKYNIAEDENSSKDDISLFSVKEEKLKEYIKNKEQEIRKKNEEKKEEDEIVMKMNKTKKENLERKIREEKDRITRYKDTSNNNIMVDVKNNSNSKNSKSSKNDNNYKDSAYNVLNEDDKNLKENEVDIKFKSKKQGFKGFEVKEIKHGSDDKNHDNDINSDSKMKDIDRTVYLKSSQSNITDPNNIYNKLNSDNINSSEREVDSNRLKSSQLKNSDTSETNSKNFNVTIVNQQVVKPENEYNSSNKSDSSKEKSNGENNYDLHIKNLPIKENSKDKKKQNNRINNNNNNEKALKKARFNKKTGINDNNRANSDSREDNKKKIPIYKQVINDKDNRNKSDNNKYSNVYKRENRLIETTPLIKEDVINKINTEKNLIEERNNNVIRIETPNIKTNNNDSESMNSIDKEKLLNKKHVYDLKSESLKQSSNNSSNRDHSGERLNIQNDDEDIKIKRTYKVEEDFNSNDDIVKKFTTIKPSQKQPTTSTNAYYDGTVNNLNSLIPENKDGMIPDNNESEKENRINNNYDNSSSIKESLDNNSSKNDKDYKNDKNRDDNIDKNKAALSKDKNTKKSKSKAKLKENLISSARKINEKEDKYNQINLPSASSSSSSSDGIFLKHNKKKTSDCIEHTNNKISANKDILKENVKDNLNIEKKGLPPRIDLNKNKTRNKKQKKLYSDASKSRSKGKSEEENSSNYNTYSNNSNNKLTDTNLRKEKDNNYSSTSPYVSSERNSSNDNNKVKKDIDNIRINTENNMINKPNLLDDIYNRSNAFAADHYNTNIDRERKSKTKIKLFDVKEDKKIQEEEELRNLKENFPEKYNRYSNINEIADENTTVNKDKDIIEKVTNNKKASELQNKNKNKLKRLVSSSSESEVYNLNNYLSNNRKNTSNRMLVNQENRDISNNNLDNIKNIDSNKASNENKRIKINLPIKELESNANYNTNNISKTLNNNNEASQIIAYDNTGVIVGEVANNETMLCNFPEDDLKNNMTLNTKFNKENTKNYNVTQVINESEGSKYSQDEDNKENKNDNNKINTTEKERKESKNNPLIKNKNQIVDIESNEGKVHKVESGNDIYQIKLNSNKNQELKSLNSNQEIKSIISKTNTSNNNTHKTNNTNQNPPLSKATNLVDDNLDKYDNKNKNDNNDNKNNLDKTISSLNSSNIKLKRTNKVNFELKKNIIASFIQHNKISPIRIKYFYTKIKQKNLFHQELTYQMFIEFFEIEDSLDSKQFFKKFSYKIKDKISVKNSLILLLNNTNLHKEEKFKFSFLMLDEENSGFISKTELDLLLSLNFLIKESGKEVEKKSIKVIEEMKKININSSCDVFEFDDIFSLVKTKVKLFYP